MKNLPRPSHDTSDDFNKAIFNIHHISAVNTCPLLNIISNVLGRTDLSRVQFNF